MRPANRAEAYTYRARSLYKLERYQESLAPYDSALVLYQQEDFPRLEELLEMRVNRAWALYRTGNGPAAYCEAQKAARLYPKVGDFPRRRELMGEALKLLPLAFEHGGSPEYCQGTASRYVPTPAIFAALLIVGLLIGYLAARPARG